VAAAPVLEVRDLVKHFPVRGERGRLVHAVNGVSFDALPGETLALIGESGSGKTTVGRCILGLTRATSGSITLGGQDVTRLTGNDLRRLRARMQMVFQDPRDSLNPRMRCGQILEEPLANFTNLGRAERRARVQETLELVALAPEVADAYPGSLTGGEQQRIGIARALATRPDLVILDEPTSELDVSVRGEIVRLLRRLQAELGLTYIFISHDMTAVREVSHRIAIMYLGEIVEVAAADELFAEQYHPYSQALLASVLYPDPDIHHSAIALEGEIPSPIDLPTGCFLHPRCPYRTEQTEEHHPELTDHGGRAVRCWRVEEILADPARALTVRSAQRLST